MKKMLYDGHLQRSFEIVIGIKARQVNRISVLWKFEPFQNIFDEQRSVRSVQFMQETGTLKKFPGPKLSFWGLNWLKKANFGTGNFWSVVETEVKDKPDYSVLSVCPIFSPVDRKRSQRLHSKKTKCGKSGS